MAYYRQVGVVPPQRHTQLRDDEGRLLYEELMGEEGFSSDSSLLYHRGVPSAIVDSDVWELPDQGTTPNHPLRPRHLRLHALAEKAPTIATGFAAEPAEAPPASAEISDAVIGRRLVLGNGDVRIGYVVATEVSPYYRNAVGDECVFVEAGSGVVETVFGALSYRAGDYVVIPRATTHRWLPG